MKACASYRAFLLAAFFAIGLHGNSLAKERNRPLDKLLSFTHAFNEKLRPTIEKKLLLTPASHGRMIRLHGPPEVGESAVSVNCSRLDACYVTLTRAGS